MMLAVRKDMVREACRRAGVAGPAFRVATRPSEVLSFAREVGYPVVVKPVDLCASEKVALVLNDVEAVRAFDEAIGDTLNSRGQPRQRVALVESYIDGDELCVETISEAGRTTVLGISGKTLSAPPGFLEVGSHVPAELGETGERAVAEYVRSVLAAIGHGHGVGHVEVRLGRNGPTLIEVNPRMGGDYVSELYEHTTGVDISALEIGLAVGAPSVHGSSLPKVHGSAALACLLPPRAGKVLRVDGSAS
jgi:biotin carboxylase